MPVDEAVDLILTLPSGSLWRESQIEYGELSELESAVCDIKDELRRFMQLYATGTTEGAQIVDRPEHLRARKAAAIQASEARRRITETEWEEV